MLVALLSTAAFAFVSFGTSAEQSSADGYGYYWTDSNAPTPSVAYSWIDVTATGSSAGFWYDDSDYVGPVSLGFDFTFYGNTYNSVYISTDGYIQFGAGSYSGSHYTVPSTSGPENIIAPFWSDLVVYYPTYNYGQVYYDTIGVSPNQQFVVEYHQVSLDYEYDLLTFEVILNETGEVWFQYQDMNGVDGSYATVGMEDSAGYMGCLYSYDTASISDGLAVMFQRGPLGFGSDQSGFASRGSYVYYTLTVTNGQAVTDSFDITVDYSLLGWSVALYDSAWNPLVDNNANTFPDTGDMAPGASTTIYAVVYTPPDPIGRNETTVLMATSFGSGISDPATLITETGVGVLGAAHSSWGYDSDSDGDYDALNVSISVEMLTGSPMVIYTELYDGVGDFIYSMYSYPAIPAGSQTAEVQFSGEDVYSSLDDGPYQVYIVLLDEEWRFLDSGSYFTDPYLYTEFDPPAALFVPPYSDYARDDDGNGLYDFLVVNTTIEVHEPGYYSVMADLYDEYNWDFIGYVENGSYFTAGVYDVQLLFQAMPINQSILDYYCYVGLDLVRDNSTNVDSDYYYTAYYLYSDFEGPGASFVTPFSDAAADTDGDWYYNHVDVTLYLECFVTGLYDLEISVLDPSWDDFMAVHETVSLTAGLTVSYTFQLDGDDIRENGISGEYYTEMYLYSNATGVEQDHEYYYTGYYYYSDFDPVGLYFDYCDDFGRDLDSDGYYDELVVVAYIYPYSTGDFYVTAYIEDYWYDYVKTVDEVISVVEGVTYEWEITLSAYEVLTNDQDGYYYLYLEAWDVDETYQYDYTDYWTSYYYLDYFDPIGAFFLPPYDDYGRDDDSDGYFDYLVVELWVNASTEGYYDIEVEIYGPGYWYYDTLWFELYLYEGDPVEVLVEIPAASVWSGGSDGYWYLYMYTYDHYTSTQFDDDSYTTDYYSTSSFDSPAVQFDPPHNDYGLDTDSDGYYDYLMFEIELDCYEAGTYTVFMDLYYYGTYITSLWSTESMSVGNEDVDFAVEGWLLYYFGVSGYYSADLWVEDSEGNVLDYDYIDYTVNYYYSWDFEGVPAWFSPPHSDQAVDEDSDSLYDYLQVNVSVEVDVAGDYVVTALLYDDWWNPVHTATASAYLGTGVHELQLFFDAWVVTMASSDPYYVYLELYDENGNAMDSDSFYLGAYDQADFDPAMPTIESVWAYDAPDVDGEVGADEWFGAVPVDLLAADGMNEVQATVYVLNDGEMLYILIDATGDLTETEGDMAAVAFDTANDETETDGGDDQFSLEAGASVTYTEHLVYDDMYGGWVSDCAPFDELLADHDGLEGAAGFAATPALAAPHRVYELSIPLALLGVAPGDTLGLGGFCEYSPMVWDLEDYSYSTWPVHFEDVPAQSMYGDLVLSEEPPLTTVELDGTAGEAGWYVSAVEVTLTATGGTGGVANTSYNIDGAGWLTYEDPFVIDDDGLHTVQFYSIDMGGNEEPVRSVQVMVDTVAPVTSASAEGTVGLADWITSAATVEFDVSEASSGVAVTMYRLDGGDWTELTGSSIEVSEDGEHTVEFYSVDVAGHEEAASSIDFKVDASGPETACTVDGSTVTLSPLDNASGVAATWYRIDGGEWMAYANPFEVSGEGMHTVEYYSVDAAGNNETAASVQVEGKAAGLLGVDTWIWAVLILVVVAVVAMLLFLLMRRRPAQPMQMVPGEAVVQQPAFEEPPPPPAQ
ncbi:MAG: hypothetical protein AB1793_08405 [Candidatus Thermoplasmatota archaeon]